MNELAFSLRNPPIVEAVVDLECDFQPGFDLAALEHPAAKLLKDRYPSRRQGFLQEFSFEASLESEPKQSMRRAIEAIQFLSDDNKQIVQVRARGYSFNRLAPYSSFDEYLAEIARTWQLFREIAHPVLIRMVRVRYINRILVPLEAADRVELDDYFKMGPRLPDEGRLSVGGFLSQYTATEHGTGHQVTTVLTAQQPVEDKFPVIFDNAAFAVVEIDPGDWVRIERVLKSLRDLKNHVFKNTLTDKCLNLFQ